MRNNTPPKKKMIGTSASDLAAQARANAAKVAANSAKVAANSAKVKANATKVKANAASVKMATAKVTPKEMDSIPMKNDAINKFSAKKTDKVVGTPTSGTRGKSYLIDSDKSYDEYGTIAQRDSAIATKYFWNNPESYSKGDFNKRFPGESSTKGSPTKQGLANNPVGYSRMSKAQRDALPDYVAPKNTGAGALRRTSEVKGATGTGGCQKGYRLDFKGNCVKN